MDPLGCVRPANVDLHRVEAAARNLGEGPMMMGPGFTMMNTANLWHRM